MNCRSEHTHQPAWEPARAALQRLSLLLAVLLPLSLSLSACMESNALRDAKAKVEEGNAEIARGDLVKAVTAYRQAISFAPDYLPAHLRLGESLALGGDLPGATEQFRFVIGRDPQSAEAYAGWAKVLALAGKAREAERKYAKAFEIDPSPSLNVVADRAMVLSALRRSEEALELFRKLEGHPDVLKPQVLLHWGTSLERTKHYDEARGKYEQALEIDPDEPTLLNNLGFLLYRNGMDKERGLALMARAVSLQPGNTAFLHNYGWALLDAGHYEDATNILRRVVAATDPTEPIYAVRMQHFRAAAAKVPHSAPKPDMPDVVLVVLDTLRADHLGAYGYPRPTSPHIDALARQSVVFEHDTSAAPWTAASIASLMTGLYPSVHGLDSGPRWGPGQHSAGGHLPFQLQSALGSSQLTLAEILRRHGYRAAGFVSNIYVNSIFGFAQGFDVYDDEHAEYSKEVAKIKRRGAETNRRVFAWLDGKPPEPFFLFVHYNDAHWPYVPPAPYGEDFVKDYHGSLTPEKTTSVVETQGRPAKGLSKADLDYLVGLYDGEIQYLDSQVGRLLEKIDAHPRKRDLLLILTADHGEEFLDHGSTSHGYTLYEEMLHVPLIVHFPGHLRARRVAAPVRSIDVLPTILDLAGIDTDGISLQGGSLAPLARAETTRGPELAFSEAAYKGDQKAIRSRSGLKLIRDEEAGTTQLFDLAHDPHEREDLWSDKSRRDPQLLSALAAQEGSNTKLAQALSGGDGASKQVVLDEKTKRQLKALGYLH